MRHPYHLLLAMAVVLETQAVIRYTEARGKQGMWIPGQKTESGKVWFCFSKWDRGFVHFCQGKSLDLRGDKEGASVDTMFMADLLDGRQKARNAAVAAATHVSDDEAERPKTKKKSQQKASMRHASLAPQPPVTTEDWRLERSFEGALCGLS